MIFDNNVYKSKASTILMKYIRGKRVFSRLRISKLLDIPYNTYSRMEDNSFHKHPEVLLKVEELLGINHFDDYDYLNEKSDDLLINYMYNRNCENINLTGNNISIIQYYINCLILSDLRDEKAWNELFIIRDELEGVHKLIFYEARKNMGDGYISVKSDNVYLHAYLSYVRLKMFYINEQYIDFLMEKFRIFRLLAEYLMIDRLFELKMYDIIVLYKLNSDPIDNINYLIRNNKYVEELKLIKSLYYLKNDNIGQALRALEDSNVLDKYLIISRIKNCDFNEMKKEKIKKSKIYFFVEKEIKKL